MSDMVLVEANFEIVEEGLMMALQDIAKAFNSEILFSGPTSATPKK